MTLSDISPDDLQRLLDIAETHRLAELRYESGEVSVLIRRGARGGGPVLVEDAELADFDFVADSNALPQTASGVSVTASEYAAVESPIAGTFYRAPGPGEPPFVDIGDTVEEGQPIGMIEAMKVFSEVLSDKRGVIRAIPAMDAKPIGLGMPLVLLEPLG